MNRPKLGSIAVDAFYDNFTCGALFGKLRIPGSPRQAIDPRSLNEFVHSETLKKLPGSRSESSLKPPKGLYHSR